MKRVYAFEFIFDGITINDTEMQLKDYRYVVASSTDEAKSMLAELVDRDLTEDEITEVISLSESPDVWLAMDDGSNTHPMSSTPCGDHENLSVFDWIRRGVREIAEAKAHPELEMEQPND